MSTERTILSLTVMAIAAALFTSGCASSNAADKSALSDEVSEQRTDKTNVQEAKPRSPDKTLSLGAYRLELFGQSDGEPAQFVF